MSTTALLGQVKARLAAATTDLDWTLDTDGEMLWVVCDNSHVEVCRIEADVTEGNAQLIAHAPTDLAKLLAIVEVMQAALLALCDYQFGIHDHTGALVRGHCVDALLAADKLVGETN